MYVIILTTLLASSICMAQSRTQKSAVSTTSDTALGGAGAGSHALHQQPEITAGGYEQDPKEQKEKSQKQEESPKASDTLPSN